MAGSPAGEGVLILDVPGGPYRLSGLSGPQAKALSAHYGERCLADGASAVLQVRMYAVGETEFKTVPRAGWLNSFDFDYREDRVRIAGNRLMATLHWRPALEAALWTCLHDGPEFLETFENFFRTVVAYRLLELGGAVLHSSGVVDDDFAWLFYGHSGIGKTTVARRSRDGGRAVLSDDINALYLEGDTPMVAKMPFAGEFGHSNDRVGPYPLAGLHRLRQAATDSWAPQSTASAIATLTGSAPFLNLDPHRLPRLIENLTILAHRTTTGTLSLSLEGDIWATLEACRSR